MAQTDTTKYPILIEDFNSNGIKVEAAEIGATHMRLVDSSDELHGAKVVEGAALYAIWDERNQWEVFVVNTNGDPVWESDDLFWATLYEYGLTTGSDDDPDPYEVDLAMCGDTFGGDLAKVAEYLTDNGWPAKAITDSVNGANNSRFYAAGLEPPEEIWLSALAYGESE